MPLLLNQIDGHASSEDKSNGTGNALLLQECFLFYSLDFIIPCFGNFVNGKGTKNYSKNADFLVAILCKTYTKRFLTSFF